MAIIHVRYGWPYPAISYEGFLRVIHGDVSIAILPITDQAICFNSNVQRPLRRYTSQA